MARTKPMAPFSKRRKGLDRETDLTLRHVTRTCPELLARSLLPRGVEIRRLHWKETQVAARQRRLDRTLFVQTSQQEHLLHWEWEGRWRADIRSRIFEYHVLLSLALLDEAQAGQRPPGIESMVVLLDGRRAPPLPEEGIYRTSPLDCAFSGVQFRIEAVYLRTVDELLARDNAFWLIFTPLAVDATPERIKEVMRRVQAIANTTLRDELLAAMLVMAKKDHRKRGLDKSITSVLEEEKKMVIKNWFYKQGYRAGVKRGVGRGVEKGIERGIEKGIEKGIEQGIEKGIEQGIEKGIEQGIEKGIEHGRLEEARVLLRRVLQKRGLRLSEKQKARIDTCSDLKTLEQWLDEAIVASSATKVFTISAS